MDMRQRQSAVTGTAWRHAVLLLLLVSASPATAKHPLEDIRQNVERFVHAEFASLGNITAVEVTRLDPRLALARCDQPLEPFVPNGQRRLGNATIGVRCDGQRPWTLYVPVRITSSVNILTARRPLSRGTVLAADDLVTVERDAAGLPYGYFTDPAQLIGQQLKRSVRAGDILTPAMVAPAPLVQRGQRVWIATQGGGVNVAMEGEALQDGAAGERIRVRNLSSKRVVEAEVVSDSLVRVPW